MNRIILLIIVLAALVSAQAWQRSFQAGGTDTNGEFTGGTEIMHLVAHKGKLFAANSYWTEKDTNSMHASQVLVREKTDGAWKQDLAIPGALRTEFLGSFVFTRNSSGAAMQPDTLLIAVGIAQDSAKVYVRDDSFGAWTYSTIPVLKIAGLPPSTRSLGFHNDIVSGRQVLVAGVNIGANVFLSSARYNAGMPGKLSWSTTPELHYAKDERVMAFCEADGALYATSSGDSVANLWRRNDGASPGWELVWSNKSYRGLHCNMRGITPVPNPTNSSRQDILFYWADQMIRVNPDNAFHDTVELDISPFVDQGTGMDAKASLAAYNNMVPFYDAQLRDSVMLIGTQMTRTMDMTQRRRGIYLKRVQHAASIVYHIDSIADPQGTQVFQAVRCFCVSPFPQDHLRVLYAGGYDGDSAPNHLTAWIWRGDDSGTSRVVNEKPVQSVNGIRHAARRLVVMGLADYLDKGVMYVDISGRSIDVSRLNANHHVTIIAPGQGSLKSTKEKP